RLLDAEFIALRSGGKCCKRSATLPLRYLPHNNTTKQQQQQKHVKTTPIGLSFVMKQCGKAKAA
ncbi:unnamed protein product, partial [Ceratitis capitata]